MLLFKVVSCLIIHIFFMASNNCVENEGAPNLSEGTINNSTFANVGTNLTFNSPEDSGGTSNLTKDIANISLGDLVSNLTFNSHIKDKGALNITETTINSTIESNEVVFLLFYTDRTAEHGVINLSLFDETADKVRIEFPKAGQIVLGKVECDREESLFKRFNIGGYPSFRLIRNGQIEKRNYEGERTVEAWFEYVKKELEDPIKEFQDIDDLGTLDPKKRTYVGYFDSKDVPEYDIFRQVASKFKHYCQFRAGFGEVVAKLHPPGQAILVLRYDATLSNKNDEIFQGSLLNYNEVNHWMSENYVPLVRKTSITFENVRDFIVEHLPMLVLFHKSGHDEVVKQYTDLCESTFMYLKNKLLFLTSDDPKYALRLRRFNKSETDLPLIGYERTDFHSYLFGGIRDMEVPGKLQLFVDDHICDTPRDNGEAPNLTHETIDSTLANNEVVFIMFYSGTSYGTAFDDIPNFNDAAKKVKEEFPEAGQIFLGKVDINIEKSLQSRFGIWGFPELIVIRNRQPMRRRYHGKRTVEELVKFVKKEMEDPIIEFNDLDDLGTLDPKKRMYIGYFDHKDCPEYDIFRQVASIYKYYCQFRAGFGEVVAKMHPPGQPILVFRSDVTLSNEQDETFNGSLLSYGEVHHWISENYNSLVNKKSITCKNELDFYRERLLMLILFHKPGDDELVKRFTHICESNFMHLKNKLLFLTSDDEEYMSSLHSYSWNICKSPVIPLIFIVADSGTLLYAFKDIEELEVPGNFDKIFNDISLFY